MLLPITLLLGGLGGHKFYLRRYSQGALYLAFCWFFFVPFLVALIEFVVYTFTSEDKLNERYGEVFSAPPSKWSVAFATLTVAIALVVVSIFGQVYVDRRDRDYVALALAAIKPWREAVETYYAQTHRFPSSLPELGQSLPPAGDAGGYGTVTLRADGALTLTLTSKAKRLEGKTVIITAKLKSETGPLEWDCTGGTVAKAYRPSTCR